MQAIEIGKNRADVRAAGAAIGPQAEGKNAAGHRGDDFCETVPFVAQFLHHFSGGLLAGAGCFLGPFPLGDVHRREVAPPIRAGEYGNAFQMQMAERPVVVGEGDFAVLPGGSHPHSLQKGVERGPGLRRDEDPQSPIDQAGAFQPEQRRSGQIRFPDRPVVGHGQVAHRRKVVEIGIFFQAPLELLAQLQQGVVLHFQLDLVNLEFMEQAVVVRIALAAADSDPLFPQPRFRLLAQRFGRSGGMVGIRLHGAPPPG